ncbi:MAG: lytic transglycosylase domain-containing protein [Luminiphilus sp.]|nr:lytic transglycosylase domain-containing protein [Luminiphilus sp.]
MVIDRACLALLCCLYTGLNTAHAQTPEDDRFALRTFLEQSISASSGFEDRFDAEVWLLDMQTRLQPFMPDSQERVQFLTQLHREALAADLPPELVLALIEVESHFDRFAVSRVGAQGYMQVMPFWKDEIGRPDDNLTDSETNLRYGCRILQFYWQREAGDWHRALAAYNGSLGRRTYSDKVYKAWQSRWRVEPLDW